MGRRLAERYETWRAGKISFAEFDARVQGWINHVRYANTWRLREKVLSPFVWAQKPIENKNSQPLRGGQFSGFQCAAISATVFSVIWGTNTQHENRN